MIGTVIDGCYRVDSLLGEGSFGRVYRCWEIPLSRAVAVKIVIPDKSTERDLKRFLGEAHKLAKLNHPNVVHVYKLGALNGHPFIVMELVEGRTLRAALGSASLPVPEAVRVMRQLAGGLQALHSGGIIHCDLSPNNMMLTTAGGAKIIDLGLARDTTRLSSMETQGPIEGTLAYIAPEVVRGRPVDARAETFSFGVILYEVLAARHPFHAEHLAQLFYNITEKEPASLDTLVENCPPILGELVTRCLAKDPAQRPETMAEVEGLLGEILGRAGLDRAVPVSDSQIPSSPRLTPRNPYLNRVMIKRAEDFFGRRQEIRRIFARLNATPPGSVSLVGDRTIGKSSLLNHVYMRQQRQEYLEVPERMVMVFLDLSEEKNMSIESFVRVMLGITLHELRGRLDVSDCSLDLSGVKVMVRRLHDAGYKLALLLDGFDAVTTNPNFDLEFFASLRSLAGHYNVAYVTSSARNLQVLCHSKEISNSPFFNIFSNMPLSVFSREEAEEVIRVPSERAGRPLAPYSSQILEMAGLFPFFLQMACAHTFEYLEEIPAGSAPDFIEIRRRFYAEARLHFRHVWENFDSHEKSAVRRVARHQRVPDSLLHVLEELEARHFVEPDAPRPRLFAPTFQEFVTTEGDPPKPSLLRRLLSLVRRLFRLG